MGGSNINVNSYNNSRLENEIIDNIICGAFKEGKVTLIYGDQGTGKTLLCFLAAIKCLKYGFKAIYISTERPFAIERIIQLIKDHINLKELLKNLIVLMPNDFSEQTLLIKKLEFFISPKIRLIVFDNITDEYLNSLTGKKKTAILINKALNEQMAILKYISKKRSMPIIVTGHLIEPSSEKMERDVAASKVIRYWCDNIIRLEKKGEKRILTIEKFYKDNVEYIEKIVISFRITEGGIVYDKGIN
jgi:predicted ATP-dependent serine protease